MKSRFTPRLVARVDRDVVGLRREAEVLCAALEANRHVVLEGPPGTGKSTLLRAVADGAGVGLVFVEGNAELTPARFVGHHDPALVLQTGYRNDAFVEGPLLRAMREGLLLYVEELNRVPEETLNLLITALAEGEIHVPRVGMVEAAAGFRLVAAMNPFDAVGTARIGQAIYDRMCRITIPYQDEPGERRIVARTTGVASPHTGLAVAIGRASREHPDVRMGSSVRGAIDMVHLADELRRIRAERASSRETLLDAALAAFTGRIRLDESCERRPEEVITEIFDGLADEGDESPPPTPARGRGGGQTGTNTARGRILEGKDAAGALREGSRRTRGRVEMAGAHADFQRVSPALGQLDQEAFDELRRRDPDAATRMLSDLVIATDRELKRKARRLAAKIFVGLARTGQRPRPGYRRMVSTPGAAAGDVDLEQTLDRAGGRPRRAEDLVLREWRSAERAACLLLDHSGSMSRGLALAAVAAASVALVADGRADCSVVAFNNDAVVLKAQGRRRAPQGLVSDILSLRAGGSTDLGLALRAAAAQLARARAPERVVIVMSDCLATTGGDPLAALSGIDRLHVLGTSADPGSVASGRALAERARGRYLPAGTFAQVTQALTTLLA